MDAVEYLKSNISVLDIMKRYNFKHIMESSTEIRSCCGIHGGDESTAFVVNKNNGLWYCHTGCKTGGNIFNLISLLENLSIIDSIHFLAEMFNLDISDRVIIKKSNNIIKEHTKWMESIKKRSKVIIYPPFDLESLGTLYELNSYRQFNNEFLNQFGIKYCSNNKRIVVPIHKNNQCIGVTMRRTDKHPAKWLHQPNGIRTGNFLYNIDNVPKSDNIILTEAPFDALTYERYGYHAVATLGSHLTEEQEKLILQHTYNLTLSYDADKAGIRGTNDIIKRLRNKVNITIANLPIGKDPNDLSEEEIHFAIQNKYKLEGWKNYE